ncbi:MAG: 30S ribosomal protein S12 methylthiotransferase RimO [Firmicutes bacterium]|nr:30S ribosomal protein S12 methylthiotransferase RimO [Bacillota bacterium]
MKAAICSLGCAKNLVDSERMMSILKEHGYALTGDFEDAEIIIVNTCGFIASAKEESIDAIIQYAQLKQGRCRCLVVTGCLVKKYQDELEKEIPEVDLWLTSLNFELIGQCLDSIFHGEKKENVCSDFRRVLTTPNHWAYLKIAEGCNNSCTFCTIPQMRGPYVSRTIEDIVYEAKGLIERGVKEVNLLAQDTTVYGKDLYGEPKLKELLKELVKLDFLRIRILYSYPNRIDRELIELMAKEDKICKYLDIPMQHSEDNILRAMGRPERREKLDKLLAMIREVDPNFAIRSTFIVGFPGETDEDFDGLCGFLKEAHLDWVGAFPYSREEDTVAYSLPDQIDEETKNDRYDTIMALLSRCSADQLERWVGKTETVIIDGVTEEEDPLSDTYRYYGRCSFQAPEVDGIIYLSGGDGYDAGDVVTVEITGSDVYDLTGRILDEQ